MDKENYIVMVASEDGFSIDAVSKETLLLRLANDYWGEKEIGEKIPGETDPNYWGDQLVIIKGDVVVPRPKKVVEEYEID